LQKKKDIFGLLPTGFGKSMTFILFPLILDQVIH
jgi:superfamily II DNA helicase RecQ